MSSESNQPTPAATTAEPSASRATVPLWLFVLMLLLLYCGAIYFDRRGGWFSPKVYGPYVSIEEVEHWQPVSSEDPGVARGKFVFRQTCELCHNPDGMGKPNQAPPLAGSEWVQIENPARLIRIPLYGLEGPITVKGQRMAFPAAMVAIGAALPEDDLAAVLTYVRQAWGNKASPVSTDQVKAVKAQVGNHPQPFNPERLMAVPEK
jgi:mono/diheme cytochrome c family protein